MSAPEVQDPLEELQRENELLERLLERLEEIALILKDGKDVASGEIGEGLRLVERYLKVHGRRMDEDLQPEARAVAMPTCFEHLDRIRRDHSESYRRVRDALGALARYEEGVPGSRETLADSIEELATGGHDVIVYEGDYPLSCLVSTLPEDAASRVRERFEVTDGDIADAEIHIGRLLASRPGDAGAPLTVRCATAGCALSASARVVAGSGGRLGLQAPPGGWSVRPQEARLGREGTTRVRVDFFCPTHAAGEPPEHAAQTRSDSPNTALETSTSSSPPASPVSSPNASRP